MPQQNASNPKTYTASCHCGAVRIEADLDLASPAGRCNCTICTKVAQTGMNVSPSALRLLAGEEHVTKYHPVGGVNWRAFCKKCGVHVFGGGNVPELGGDFRSVNLNCLDEVDPSTLPVVYWDGRHNNWQAGPRSTPWPVRA